MAIDDLDNIDENNTAAVIADIEALREHLGISAWRPGQLHEDPRARENFAHPLLGP
ncbi:hypothetical protein [Paramicrobacterium chengjingii]|uniref:hypothetical protein n=1 Tax=Paramicrobacterium chengjingii TaxID=2769067 RepID=UPI001FD3A8B0|nr:hypothetical protein [Microbacterium chengjingii]